MVTVDGRDMGEHAGLMYYTTGQRGGLGIGGRGGDALVCCRKRFEPKYPLCRPRFLRWFRRMAPEQASEGGQSSSMPEEFTLCSNSKFRYRLPDSKVTVHVKGDKADSLEPQRDYTQDRQAWWRRVSRWWLDWQCLSRWTSLSVHLDGQFSLATHKSNRNDGQSSWMLQVFLPCTPTSFDCFCVV